MSTSKFCYIKESPREFGEVYGGSLNVNLEQIPDQWCEKNLGAKPVSIDKLPGFKHIFTHFELTIYPVLVKITQERVIRETGNHIWYTPEAKLPGGIAAPVEKLLKQIRRHS